MNYTLFSLLVLGAVAAPAPGQTVRASGGNVYYVPLGGQSPRQLTATGRDGEPALSPNGQLVAFVRARGDSIDAGAGPVPATDLWVIGIDGTGARRVLEARDDQDVKRLLAGLSNLQFSPDGRTLYFLSAAWATSDAVHVVDVATGRERFVCAGNSLETVRTGRYVGHLLVEQHRYHREGGSYDWVWLFASDGREIALVGDPEAPDFEARLAEFRGQASRP